MACSKERQIPLCVCVWKLELGEQGGNEEWERKMVETGGRKEARKDARKESKTTGAETEKRAA